MFLLVSAKEALCAPIAFEAPPINNIADKIYFLTVVIFQEIKKQVRLTCTRSQMDIRQKDCFVVIGLRVNVAWRNKLLHCKFLIQNSNAFIGKQVLQIYNASKLLIRLANPHPNHRQCVAAIPILPVRPAYLIRETVRPPQCEPCHSAC